VTRTIQTVAVVTITVAAAFATATATAATPRTSFTKGSCVSTQIQTAINQGGVIKFTRNCDLHISKTIVVNNDVTINGAGHYVVLDGLDPTNTTTTRVLKVTGGTLILKNLLVAGGLATGRTGHDGSSGGQGTDGAAPGDDGGTGHDGNAGADGGVGRGGGILIQSGGTVVADNVTFKGNTAQGGLGGNGGAGGTGGGGATSASTGGDAGAGGTGGNGGRAGSGGAAYGGAVFNAGNLALHDATFRSDFAFGGTGGSGGLAGDGGSGGAVTCPTACTGNGGDGGLGGDTGASGAGGNAIGGAIYSTGAVSIKGVTFDSGGVQGGTPGSGLVGGGGGAAGCNDGECATGGNGGRGGDGGDGGRADGGAFYASHNETHKTTYLDNIATVAPDCAMSLTVGCGGVGGIGTVAGANGDDGTDGTIGKINGGATVHGLTHVHIVTRHLRAGHKGAKYHATLDAHGGVAPYSFRCAHLPKGLHCASNGTISGTPKKVGRAHVTITVRDRYAVTPTKATANLPLRIKH
jgi:hypothetical protein